MFLRRGIDGYGACATVGRSGLFQRGIDLLSDGDNIAQGRRIPRKLIREGGTGTPDGRQRRTRRRCRILGGGLGQFLGELTQLSANYRLGIVGAQYIEIIKYGGFGVLLIV